MLYPMFMHYAMRKTQSLYENVFANRADSYNPVFSKQNFLSSPNRVVLNFYIEVV